MRELQMVLLEIGYDPFRALEGGKYSAVADFFIG
jgi:hypothetical protein